MSHKVSQAHKYHRFGLEVKQLSVSIQRHTGVGTTILYGWFSSKDGCRAIRRLTPFPEDDGSNSLA